jgi:hypothetical protein
MGRPLTTCSYSVVSSNLNIFAISGGIDADKSPFFHVRSHGDCISGIVPTISTRIGTHVSHQPTLFYTAGQILYGLVGSEP